MNNTWTPAQLLAPGVGVILDTETTDLDGRIIEISIIDAATGAVLVDQLVDPQGVPICAQAQTVHHINVADLVGAPTFAQVRPHLEQVLANRVIMAWNAPLRPGADCSRIRVVGDGNSGVGLVLPDAIRSVPTGVPMAQAGRPPPGSW